MRLVRTTVITATAAALLLAPATAQTPMTGTPGGELPELTVLGEIDPSVRKANAIVNGDVVTDTDVEQRLNLVVAANGGKIDPEERTRLRLQVLRNLIDEKLQIQEAESNDVKISDAEVDQAYGRVAQNFRQSPQAFEAFLRKSGSSPTSIKSQIKGELAWSRLLRRRVEPFVAVGDDEVQQVIAKLNEAKGKDEFHVGEIFISATPETIANVRADAQRIVGQIRGGASFVAYARQFSEASSAGVGGDLGWIRAEQLNERIAPVVTSLPEGGVSEPLDVPGGVAIMALIGKRQVLAADPNEAVLSLKQLSIGFDGVTTEAQAQARAKAFQEKTSAMGGCGRAEAVAQELGAEIATNDSIKLKDLPGPLQTMMKQLSIGQTTPPFGSAREGLRVLVLCGRDDAQAQAAAPSFDQVYAQMNDERVNMRARRYLRDLRRDAIVDYR